MNEVQNVAAFPHPISAARNGRPCRILAIGDQEGKSPVYLAVNENGESTWEAVKDFLITDPNALPMSTEVFQRLNSQTAGASSRR